MFCKDDSSLVQLLKILGRPLNFEIFTLFFILRLENKSISFVINQVSYRALDSVGAAAPTDFWNGAFPSTLFIKNSISLLIKLAREFKNLKSAPTDLRNLTRALSYKQLKECDYLISCV